MAPAFKNSANTQLSGCVRPVWLQQ